jgi:plastocyanin
VTWSGDFTVHPLGPFGGDTPNPITSAGATGSVTIAFPTAGTFGYHCQVHAQLNGAILVVP